MSNFLLNSENIFWLGLVEIEFISHPHAMSRSAGYVWPLLGITGTLWSSPSTCKHRCSVPSMTHITRRSSRPHSSEKGKLVLWLWLRPSTKPRRKASLHSMLSDGPGRSTKHTMEHNMSPRSPHFVTGGGWTKTKSGKTLTTLSTTCPENHRSCLYLVRAPQLCKVSPFYVFQTPNGPWGMSAVVE